MTDEEFEQVVRATIKSLPKEFLIQLDNLEIVIEERPPYPSLLGLYRGVPKTGRGLGYFALPDKITIYKEPLLRISANEKEAKKNIKNTVLHEIGHHFGLSDKELYKLKKIN
jgi:predicted Zn-dependent protease with MMP-like domain